MLKLEELRNHLATFTMQKAAVEQQFHQIMGAMNFTNHLIATIEKAEAAKQEQQPAEVQDGGAIE